MEEMLKHSSGNQVLGYIFTMITSNIQEVTEHQVIAYGQYVVQEVPV
jgi:hypothetical protein